MQNKFAVKYVDLPTQYKEDEKTLLKSLENIASSGQFILREEVALFEKEVAKYLGVKYSVGVNSGTDALFLSLKAMGIKEGDEVITVSHTFIATIATIVHCGASPILADIKSDANIDADKIEALITPKTKALVIVHMNGKVCDMDEILPLVKKHKLLLLEDAAQAFGSQYNNRFAGSFGECGAFSFHPMKVLGCMGDGGLVTTNDESIYKKLLLLRNHGQESKSSIVEFGYSSRLDNIQAAILLHRLRDFETTIKKRLAVARYYIEALQEIKEIVLPDYNANNRRDVFSSFVISAKDRDKLFTYLLDNGIEVAIHWATPNHNQSALALDNFKLDVTESYSKSILSLPIHPFLTQIQLSLVVEKIKEFYAQ